MRRMTVNVDTMQRRILTPRILHTQIRQRRGSVMFHDYVNISEYIVSNDRMFHKLEEV
jgi:hypothetical protein